LREAYAEQTRGLLDGGADILLIETIFDTLNAKAAIHAILDETEARGLRADHDFRHDHGFVGGCSRTDAGGVLERGAHAMPLSVGLNCALGAKEMRAHVAELARITDTLVCAYPNAGLPNEFGRYDESPEFMAELLANLPRPASSISWWLLRHHAGAHSRDRGRDRRQVATRRAAGDADAASLRLEPFALTPEIPFVNVASAPTSPLGKFRKLVTAGTTRRRSRSRATRSRTARR